MLTPFSSDDLGRIFGARVLTKGRTLALLGMAETTLEDASIAVVVEHLGLRHTARISPFALGRRVMFDMTCSCGQAACAHLAAGALMALDRYPALRQVARQDPASRQVARQGLALRQVARPEPAVSLASVPAGERQQLMFELAPGTPPHACFVTTLLIGERSGLVEDTTPRQILAARSSSQTTRVMARLLGGGDAARMAVPSASVPAVLGLLSRLGKARWQPTGKRLSVGLERAFRPNAPPDLPPHSAIILGDLGPWYVDGATGAVGRVRLHPGAVARVAETRIVETPVAWALGTPVARALGTPVARSGETLLRPRSRRPRQRRFEPAEHAAAAPIILERAPTPVLRMRRIDCADDFGRPQQIDALTLDFDYDGELTASDDERQFVRVTRSEGPSFVRRDRAIEAMAIEALRQDGFSQMRVTDGSTARGRRVFIFRGNDAAERWRAFAHDRLPALQSLGWRNLLDRDFGPRSVQSVGEYDVWISDAVAGSFSLDFGIEIDGARVPLLPILNRLLERGGIEAAHIVDDMLITSLDDGRILKLPAERIRRLLAVMEDLLSAARRTADGGLLLAEAEAASVLDLEDLLTTRWENAAAIAAYAQRFRGAARIPPVVVPAGFRAMLRPYQQVGVAWLQHLRANGLGGFLADDMGLGKTAQTIAHIVIEQDGGRLDRPVLIVVPTSLVTNWTAELVKFAPHLRVVVLHDLARHARREQLSGVHVVVTTYTVLARDVAAMKLIPWHLVVLDEAQVIKNPDAKATKAVCQLDTRHRLCLSGTPIENNLQELWSEFAFLMPGLLGDRKRFTKRFRTPIEKNGNAERRMQLIRRIKPFLLRRTKSEVATDLPLKHTILRRITLAPEQRDLYETIRGTLTEKVREQISGLTPAQSRVVMLDALLKLRQVCGDPRLVKLPSARLVEKSSKLDDLLEMLGEMIPEGRRILLFSQFTSMLDLIKPRLRDAGIRFVELRGDTRDRAAPVRAFQADEVPLFLISLKAGGRGLNLTNADTVIHYDPWWNPAVEDQASDRAHRIGQTKPVFVYKLIAADTVEERIVELQQRKAELANIALSDDGALSVLGFDDIAYLFGAVGDRLAA